MKKTLSWILIALLVLGTVTACRRNTPTPMTPSASPDTTPMSSSDASSSPLASGAPDMSQSPAPSDGPVADASLREYEVTYPSRGVNVHATVVLPGSSQLIGGAAGSDATPSGSPGASASPDASAASPASTDAAPSGSPDRDASAVGTSALPSSDAGSVSAANADPSATAEMHAYSTPTGSADASGVPSDAASTPDAAPDSVTMPERGWPLVVFLHGHGGERHENGGFTEIAHALARYGIASVRMDFAGSGESEEPFTSNTLTSMYTDVLAAIDFMKSTYPIDPEAVGVFGYDMGGRVALHLLAAHLFDFRAVVLLAPTNNNRDLVSMFGGQEEWDRYKMDAELNNYTTFTTVLGQVQNLSVQWFTDLEASDDPAKLAEQSFENRALVIYATNDTTVSPEVSRYVAEKLGAETMLLDTGGHSYGFYAESGDLLPRVARTSAEFFANALTDQKTAR